MIKINYMKKPFVTVHTITYNEEFIIESFIKHYRKMFPDCIIKIYDNYSTDNTVKIAKTYECEVTYFDTNDKLDDDAFIRIKNNVWKNADTNWIIVCDADEFIDINQDELIEQENAGYTIIQSNGYSIVNVDDSITDISQMRYGFRDYGYDKYILFNKKYISEINYDYGCHAMNNQRERIVGIAHIGSTKEINMFHYKWVGKNITIKRREMLRKRGISDFNKSRNFTAEYVYEEHEFPDWLESASLNVYNRVDLIKIK